MKVQKSLDLFQRLKKEHYDKEEKSRQKNDALFSQITAKNQTQIIKYKSKKKLRDSSKGKFDKEGNYDVSLMSCTSALSFRKTRNVQREYKTGERSLQVQRDRMNQTVIEFNKESSESISNMSLDHRRNNAMTTLSQYQEDRSTLAREGTLAQSQPLEEILENLARTR